MTERLPFHFSLSCIGEGNGNPLQCSCLENPRDGRAWWAAVYGVAQNRTRLKRLSSSSSRRPYRIWSLSPSSLNSFNLQSPAILSYFLFSKTPGPNSLFLHILFPPPPPCLSTPRFPPDLSLDSFPCETFSAVPAKIRISATYMYFHITPYSPL